MSAHIQPVGVLLWFALVLAIVPFSAHPYRLSVVIVGYFVGFVAGWFAPDVAVWLHSRITRNRKDRSRGGRNCPGSL